MADEANDELESETEPTEEVEKTDVEETTVVEPDDTDKLKETNKRLFERAKKAETEAKELKEKLRAEEDAKKTNQPINSPDSEELRLIAKGLSDEEIDQAKAVSKGKGISLKDALKDPLFVSFQKDFKEQERKEKAKLGASKGSSQDDEVKTFDTGITPEGTQKHKELWKKVVGR